MNHTAPRHLLKWLAAPLGLVLLVGTAAFIWGQPKREVTTRSAAAYAAYMEGWQHARAVQYADAMRGYEKAVALDSTFVMAWTRLGMLQFSFNKSAEARASYGRALARVDRVKPYERAMVEMLGLELDGTEAQRDAQMEDLVKRFPDNSEVLLLYGNRAFFAGQYEKALTAYRRLVACDPSAGETYNMIGYALTELDRFPEAVEAFQKYAFLYPDQCNPHDSLGELYLRLGRYDDADRELARALSIKPDFAWGWMHLAVNQSDQGRHDEAIARLRQGLKALGDSPEANMLETQIINQHLLAGRAESVEAICRRKIAAHPQESGSYFFLVRLHAGRGDAAAAQLALETYRQKLRASLKSAGRDFDDAQKSDFMLAECEGVAALAAGRPEEAVEWLQTAQKRTESWWVRRRLQTEEMAALLQLNRHEEVRGLAANLLKVNPNLPRVRRLCAGPGGAPEGSSIGRVVPAGARTDAAAAPRLN